MPINWNAEAEARLFAAVIKTSDGNMKFDYKAIADYMGPECTAKAVQHRITNIKAVAKDMTTAWIQNPGVAAPKTPKTPKSATKRTAKTLNGGGAENDDDGHSPAAKKAKIPRFAKAKDKTLPLRESGEADVEEDGAILKKEDGAEDGPENIVEEDSDT